MNSTDPSNLPEYRGAYLDAVDGTDENLIVVVTLDGRVEVSLDEDGSEPELTFTIEPIEGESREALLRRVSYRITRHRYVRASQWDTGNPKIVAAAHVIATQHGATK